MTQYIMDRLNVGRDEANRLRVSYTVRYGATLLGLVKHHGVDPADFLRVVHTFADLPSMVRTERWLERILRALPGRKIVLANAPSIYARAVLAELGIGALFERVIAIEDMRDDDRWRAKPDASMLRREMRRAHVRLSDAVLVEDTRGHLKRYRRLGIHTVWIVGHLPLLKTSTGAFSTRKAGVGRPHYVVTALFNLCGRLVLLCGSVGFEVVLLVSCFFFSGHLPGGGSLSLLPRRK